MTTTLASDRPSATAGHRVALDSEVDSRGAEPSQTMQALAGANRVRLEQAELKRQIGAMEKGEAFRFVADLLLDPPEAAARLQLGHLLKAIPYLGPMKINRMLLDMEFPPLALHRKVGPCPPPRSGQRVLTERQRESVARELRSYAKRVGS